MSIISCNRKPLLLQSNMSYANSALVILHPSLELNSPAMDVIRTMLSPCVIKSMYQPLIDEELHTFWSHVLLCAPALEGNSVFTWLETYFPLIDSCSAVGFIEFSNDPQEDTWLLDQRFWQFSTASVPLADRFWVDDVVRAKDFVQAFGDARTNIKG